MLHHLIPFLNRDAARHLDLTLNEQSGIDRTRTTFHTVAYQHDGQHTLVFVECRSDQTECYIPFVDIVRVS
jgi:hypothetical protein